MNQTDKDFIGHKLRRATDLINQNHTAKALIEIADAVSIVAVALESQTSGAHSMGFTALDEVVTTHIHDISGDNVGRHCHRVNRATITTPNGEDLPVELTSVGRPFSSSQVEAAALDTVKPLCRSGLLATLSGNGTQCPACGLFHGRRVVVVELSSLGLHMLKQEGAIRIGGGESNPDKYRQDDRVIFKNVIDPTLKDVVLGDVVKMFSGPLGREASIEVVQP